MASPRELKQAKETSELNRRLRSQRARRRVLNQTITDSGRSVVTLEQSDQEDEGTGKAKALWARTKAILAARIIILGLVPFLLLNFTFWGISIVGLGLESLPILNYVLPGQTLFLIFWLLSAVMGLLFMTFAAFVFTSRFVDCWSGYKYLVFLLCIFAHLAPIVSFGLPWVFGWVACVVLTQEKAVQED